MWNDVLALNRLTAMLVLIVLAVAAYAAARRLAALPVFAIRALEVRGAEGRPLQHLAAERVGRECAPRIRGTLLTTDLAEAKHAFESLPWVRTASVRRQWPGRLVVEIEEHQALARWNDEAGNRFVSLKGEAFNAPGESALGAKLPLLTGPEGSEREVARTYGELRQRLAAIGKSPQVVTLSPRQAWTVRMSDGLVLDVGREQPSSTVLSRVERFAAHYAGTVAKLTSRVDVVDLRYSNGFAVKVPGLRAASGPVSKPASRPVAKPAAKKRTPVHPHEASGQRA